MSKLMNKGRVQTLAIINTGLFIQQWLGRRNLKKAAAKCTSHNDIKLRTLPLKTYVLSTREIKMFITTVSRLIGFNETLL